MGPIGFQELIFILLILVIFFGAKKLPELAKGLGQGIKEFKKATKEITEEDVPKIDEKQEENKTE
ncbi:twin-arginine translocase TatA/TatE family subunit [candidate division KSB1 bacterium]|nr:twin-arginine translocase TatA/TatE family subunit [candidate division KSB1 bacterium]